MVQVYIDGVELLTRSEVEVTLSYDSAAMRSIDEAREARVVDLEVELLPEGEAIFGGEGYLHLSQRFNAVSHKGLITYEQVPIFEGEVTLRGVVRNDEGNIYRLRMSASSAGWADNAAEGLLSEIEVEFETQMLENLFEQRWEDEESAVQFFPVHRDTYTTTQSSVSLGIVQRYRSIDEYHPFLKIDSLLRAIASSAGYTIESKLMESDLFKRLYMSGSYVSQQNDAAKEAMDFYIEKLEDESATSDYSGRITVSSGTSSAGIDTFVDVESIESNKECFSNSNCIEYVNGAAQFTPTTEVSVGFEYRILYTSNYWIESPTKLGGFTKFYLGDSSIIEFDLENTFTDVKSQIPYLNFQYTAVIFDYDPDYYSFYITTQVDGYYSELLFQKVTAQTISFTSPTYQTIAPFGLYYKVNSSSSYVAYEGEWVLYEGYVETEGTMEIDLTIRSSPASYTPSSPKRFDPIYFECGESGKEMTLLSGSSITPYFAAYPGYGEEVDYTDLSQHEVRQSVLVESVQHLFNLRYFTDEAASKIYIDPVESIYGQDGVWDWSERLVEGESITFEDAAIDVYKVRKWGYQEEDGVTNRTNGFYYNPGEDYPEAPEEEPAQSDESASSPDYGSWQKGIENQAATDSSSSLLNPIFSPTQNDLNGLPIVGNRDDTSTADTLEFSPRVVYYMGLTEGDDNNEPSPRVVYHSEEEGVTLCFEDRDSLRGLNTYYEEQIEREESGQYVTLSLRITPFEMAALMSPTQGMPSMLSHFSLELDGELAVCRIDKIEEYSVSSGVARCKLLIIK